MQEHKGLYFSEVETQEGHVRLTNIINNFHEKYNEELLQQYLVHVYKHNVDKKFKHKYISNTQFSEVYTKMFPTVNTIKDAWEKIKKRCNIKLRFRSQSYQFRVKYTLGLQETEVEDRELIEYVNQLTSYVTKTDGTCADHNSVCYKIFMCFLKTIHSNLEYFIFPMMLVTKKMQFEKFKKNTEEDVRFKYEYIKQLYSCISSKRNIIIPVLSIDSNAGHYILLHVDLNQKSVIVRDSSLCTTIRYKRLNSAEIKEKYKYHDYIVKRIVKCVEVNENIDFYTWKIEDKIIYQKVSSSTCGYALCYNLERVIAPSLPRLVYLPESYKYSLQFVVENCELYQTKLVQIFGIICNDIYA